MSHHYLLRIREAVVPQTWDKARWTWVTKGVIVVSTLSQSWLGRIRAMLAIGALIVAGTFALGSGATAQDQECWSGEPSVEQGYPQWSEAPRMVIDPAKTYLATFETSHGAIVVELDAEAAPTTVNNFVCLARAGYYDFTVFHRVIQDFMIQGGDPTGTGTGGPGYQIEDELPSEEAPYARGTLAMANAGPDTNGSQFFIVHADQTSQFPANYSIFGQVTEGLDVLDALASVPVTPQRNENSDPIPTIGIESITITEQ